MSFVLQMAWRDSRASRRRLLLCSFSVVVGIAALVAVGSLTANIRRAIEAESKSLLGADVFVTAPAPLDARVRRYLGGLGGDVAEERMFSSMMTFPSSGGAVRLVQVRAMQGAFPFYGEFVTEPADAAVRLRRGDPVVVLEETLLPQFNVHVGDTVKLGRGRFVIAGVVKKIPGDSVRVGLLAPRAFIPIETLPATGLDGAGALARYRAMVRLPPGRDAEVVVGDMKEKFRAARLSFDTVEGRRRELGRALTNIDGFLNLVGFIALFLGGIGVASALHVYVRQKIETVAILRCLGVSSRRSFAIYVTQGLALGLVGAGLGTVAGVAVQTAMPALLKGVMPFHVDFFISWPALARGAGAGVAICLLFALLPLLAVRRVPPLAALRSAIAERAGSGRDPLQMALWVAIAAAVAGFSILQTGSVRIGLGFAGMLGLGFGSLAGLAAAAAWGARRFTPRRFPYVVRQGLANLHRPNNRTLLLLLSLGLSAFLVLTLFLARTTLLREIVGSAGGGRPNLLLFDIQDDQIGPVTKLLRARGAPVLDEAALVTLRIQSVRGRAAEDLMKDRSARIPGWTLRRDYRSTYRGHLTQNERIVSGAFEGRITPGASPIPISVEEGLFRDMRLKLGDEIIWDLDGVPLRTQVSSVRAVEWRRLDPNFFVVFPDGALEDAPKTHVVAVRAATATESAALQRALVGAFPNVTAIDVTLVVDTLDAIFAKVSFAIEFMTAFTVATGLIVVASAVFTGRYQRVRETVLLRTLGASRRQIVWIQRVEYAVLGMLAGGVACILAAVSNGLLAHFVFHATPASPPAPFFFTVAAVTMVTLGTGLLAGRGIADHPPLEVLRRET